MGGRLRRDRDGWEGIGGPTEMVAITMEMIKRNVRLMVVHSDMQTASPSGLK